MFTFIMICCLLCLWATCSIGDLVTKGIVHAWNAQKAKRRTSDGSTEFKTLVFIILAFFIVGTLTMVFENEKSKRTTEYLERDQIIHQQSEPATVAPESTSRAVETTEASRIYSHSYTYTEPETTANAYTSHSSYSSSSGSYSSSHRSYYSEYDGYDDAEDYADDNVEDYLDSGDYDDYDEAYEAAMDDYEYDNDY